MNNVVLDHNVGKPWDGDLVWSALPDAPVQEARQRFVRLRGLAKRIVAGRSQAVTGRTPAAGRMMRSIVESMNSRSIGCPSISVR